ncbi:cysteine desulfurase [Candidatus Sumerlaeota bacterium]|nr:cysteine desulfurase [Candidatus Sumerlaeota bacterium]
MDVERVRRDFPMLSQRVHGVPLVYLDNAASTHKPTLVIDAIRRVYEQDYSNIHRGVHELSQRLTMQYEEAREKIRVFLNARSRAEIVFTYGTTDSINLVAQTFGRANIGKGDEILISEMEHHSNIVPWQLLCEQTGATLKVIPFNDQGNLAMSDVEALLSERTKLVALVHVSNALGTINPIGPIIKLAHDAGAKVLVDGAQAVAHMKTDVQKSDVDFYAFSGHKVFGPTGIGVLYGKEDLLEAMPPWRGGGDMIRTVTFEKTTYADLPYKFEAGTPNIAGGIGLGAAIDYVHDIGLKHINHYENSLLAYMTRQLLNVEWLKIIGNAPCKSGAISFMIEGVHHNDLGQYIDHLGVAIRTGHHCAQPVMQHYGVTGTARASLAFYNNTQDIDRFIEALEKAKKFLL